MKYFIMIVFLAIILRRLFDTNAEPLQLSIYNKLNVRNLGLRHLVPVFGRNMLTPKPFQRCFKNNMLTNCPITTPITTQNFQLKQLVPANTLSRAMTPRSLSSSKIPHNRRFFDADLANIELNSSVESKVDTDKKLKMVTNYLNLTVKYLTEPITLEITTKNVETITGKGTLNTTYYENVENTETALQVPTENNIQSIETTSEKVETLETTHQCLDIDISISDNNKFIDVQRNASLILALDQFERKLYAINFEKFTALTAASKGDSGMSFVQSGLFLEIVLIALSTEVDSDSKNEINEYLGLDLSETEKIQFIKQIVTSLPKSSDDLKFHWSSRLVLGFDRQVSEQFISGAAEAMQMKIGHFEGNETPEAKAVILNRMIETDSEGAIRDTFEEDDLLGNIEAVLITTLYFRAHWRSAPTLLNGTRLFRNSEHASKSVRMIKINDIMQYVDLPEWDAEAIQISYSTQGLSLLLLVPRSNSLKRLVYNVNNADLMGVTERLQCLRIAATLPLYTLRMTLLLPNKLQAMGISRLVGANESQGGSLRLSQAVQRIMFWAEAGRNAYKDDGFEWDEPPQKEIIIDRPYIFYVRWRNVTLMHGNFVL